MKGYIRSLREELAGLSPRLRRIMYFLAIAPSLLWMPMVYLLLSDLVTHADFMQFIADARAAGVTIDKIEKVFLANATHSNAWVLFFSSMIVVGLIGAAFSFLMPSKPKSHTPGEAPTTTAQA